MMMKRGMSVLLSSAAGAALIAGFASTANAGAGDCCDQLEDLQRRILLLEEQLGKGGLEPEWKAAPKWSQDGFEFKVRGRLYADYHFHDYEEDSGADDRSGHGGEFRTARLGVEGKIMKMTKYKFEIDFAEDDPEITDAYLEQKWGPAKVKIGQFKTFNSLEELTSSRHITFMERADFTDVFALDRELGVGVGFGGDNWTFNVGAHGEADDEADVGNESYGFSARGTFAPIAEKTTNIHLGGHVRKIFNEDRDTPYGASGGSDVDGGLIDSIDMLATPAIAGVEGSLLYGIEAAGVYGPFSLQGEWSRVSFNSDAVADEPTFSGWYVEASVFLTGESRNYEAKKGTFGRPKVKNPVNSGGFGAWQLGVRYDYTDLDDEMFNIGTNGTISAVVNWHLNNYTKLKLQYNYSDAEAESITGGEDCGDTALESCEQNSVGFRAQIDW